MIVPVYEARLICSYLALTLGLGPRHEFRPAANGLCVRCGRGEDHPLHPLLGDILSPEERG